MSKQHDRGYLEDIRKAARLAMDFIQGLDLEQFESDLKCQSAVMYQLQVIGEATKNISKEFRAEHQEIPWKKMAGARDVLIHAYREANLKRIWKTVQESLPALLKEIEKIY